MSQLSIAQYTKNKNIRQSLAFNSATGLYWYQRRWITKEEVDKLLPLDLPYVGNSGKGYNPEKSKRFLHAIKSY
jgi:hypothetical protein